MDRSFLCIQDFEFELTCISDVHIGTGEDVLLSHLLAEPAGKYTSSQQEPIDGSNLNRDKLVSIILRDNMHKPFLPGSSLKGIFKRKNNSRFLFGEEAPRHNREEMGTGSRCYLWGGEWISNPVEEPTSLPFWNSAKCTYIDTHNAIGRRSGSVENQKLFSIEYVPVGTRFKVTGCIYGTIDEAKNELDQLLVELIALDGFKLGGKQTKRGKVHISSDQVQVTETRFDGSKTDFVSSETNWNIKVPKAPAALPANGLDMTLIATSPFIIGDGMGGQNSLADADKSFRKRTADASAEMTGETVRQVLRERCAFLEQSLCWNDRNKEDNRDLKFSANSKCSDLTSTQRLFGLPGNAGIVAIDRVASRSPNSDRAIYDGIKIDELSAGIIYGAVFSVEAANNQSYSIRILLDTSRMGNNRQEDLDLFGKLIDEVTADGIEFGALTGTGFGWFDAQITAGSEILPSDEVVQ
ncbi:MAG: hypothetical protein GY761_06810 [Hyphomicrobiales bacterium]|nr:hypothetical protein [Hyphomicrobiales bacterium]